MVRQLCAIVLACLFILSVSATCAGEIDDGQKVYNDVSPSIFTIYSIDENNEKKDARGSAVAVTDHLLATNCHVALSGNFVVIEFNKKPLLGRLYYYNQDKDICIVEVAGANLPYVNIRHSQSVKIGEEVYAIGNPLGYEKTISRGIISNKDVSNGSVVSLQTDAAISHGSSGGGLFDKNSNLIGITSYGDTQGSNIGFAIPTELILEAISPVSDKPSSDPEPSKTPPSPDIVKPAPNEPSINGVVRMGYYGNNEIGLMKWNDRCFIAIPGRNSAHQPISLAIWYATAPEGITIFSRIINADDAVKFLSRMYRANNTNYLQSKSYLFFDKNLYPLSLVSIGSTNYPVYIFATKTDLTEELVNLDYFLGQFYDYSHDSGMTSIKFGLDGFTEALAAYNKNCSSGN